MRITSKRMTILLIVLHICVGTAWAADEAQVQQLIDRMEIEGLMWRYVQALDSRDADAYADLYTEDGRLVAGGGWPTITGRAELRETIADLRRSAEDDPDREPIYHISTNWYVEFKGTDEATLNGYWMEVAGGVPENLGGTTRVIAAGREVNELVRVNGHWLIKSRNVVPDD